MPCRRLCADWKAKKPANGQQYSSGQVRCDTCDIFMYPSFEHTHNIKTGKPDDNPKNGLACNCCNFQIRTRSKSAKYGKYQDPNNQESSEYDQNSNEVRFFIALGPWSNWEHTLNNPPFRWGVNPSSTSNVGVFNALRPGDIVYYYANQDSPTPFSKRGLFGVGKVTRKYDEENERYWPDERLKKEIIYKHRFEIESLKLVQTDSEMLPWIDGLPFTKGLNRIANQDTLQKLINATQKMWNLDLNSIPTSVNYWKISPGASATNWPEQYRKGMTAVHFADLGDLSNITSEELESKMIAANLGSTHKSELKDFLKIKKGDIIIANNGMNNIVGIGRVTGNYVYDSTSKFPNTFPVDWFDTKKRKIPTQLDWDQTIVPISQTRYKQLFPDENLMENQHYLLLRHKPGSVNQWRDDIGKQYHFGKIANYTKIIPGTKTIWFNRDEGDFYYWGYGEVSSIEKENDEHFHAHYDKFNFFNDPHKENPTTDDITPKKGLTNTAKKIVDLPGWNNQMSMIEITKELYDEIVCGEEKSETFEDESLSFPHEKLNSICLEIKKHLLINEQTINKIVASLYSGKNVLLTGPVGTGKTHLAQLLPKLVWTDVAGYYPETVTATSDWTTQDVIGGIFPKTVGTDITYVVQKGCVADTVSRNWEHVHSQKRNFVTVNGTKYRGIWLVIDEFNRANIDRAFGQLFTALEYNELKIPTTKPGKNFEILKIPKDYRIIGTLNTFDKHFLFRISDALKRRFSFIEILPPKYEDSKEEKRFIVEKAINGFQYIQDKLNIHSFQDVNNDKNLVLVLDNLYDIMAFIRLSKNLGTALLISIFRLVLINYLTTKDWDISLDSALSTILLPQMESLHYWQLDSIMNFVGGRIHEMFRKYDINKKPDVDRYEDELKNLTKFLKMTNINRDATKWNSKFRNGGLMIQNLDELSPWRGKIRPILKEFRTGLEELKREKGYFDDEDEFLEEE